GRAARRWDKGITGKTERAAGQPDPEAGRGGLPEPAGAATNARWTSAGDGTWKSGAGSVEKRPVQSHRQGHRLPRLQESPPHSELAGQVELRLARHAASSDGNRSGRVQQGV